ncbi:hypothetical protein WG936_02515 [Corynebacterium sp. H127]|uniref:hypothetical protein n=1 Tax=Corynebacterium sp. H127 TaxID=3133418 RepID=UPI0030AB2E59
MRLAIPGAIAVCFTAMALSACSTSSDPGSLAVPSPVVEVANSAGFIDCFGPPIERPTAFSLDCVSGRRHVEDVSWSMWGAQHAEGTGTLVTPDAEPATVTISLGAPFADKFTSIIINDEAVWP